MLQEDAEDFVLRSPERRDSDRVKLIVDVTFERGEATGIANTRDVGIGGLYMATAADLKVGDALKMRMTFYDHPMSIIGVVVYSDPGKGVGVRFNDLPIETEAILRSNLNLV